MGLIKAVDRFDPERGVEFAGFAIPTVLGEVKRHFRDRTWSVRVPRRTQELRMAITEANNTLLHTLGRSPTVADIAVHLGITEEEVLEGLEGARAYSATSLSTPVAGDEAMSLGDTLGADDREYEMTELRMVLGAALAHLDEREQTHPVAPLLRQHDPVGHRRADRRLADARVPADHPRAGEVADGIDQRLKELGKLTKNIDSLL